MVPFLICGIFSSDQTVKNPLLLLGQYSDDEEDEESSGSPTPAAVSSSPKDLTDQVGSKLFIIFIHIHFFSK